MKLEERKIQNNFLKCLKKEFGDPKGKEALQKTDSTGSVQANYFFEKVDPQQTETDLLALALGLQDRF